jgi:hypothetical protein
VGRVPGEVANELRRQGLSRGQAMLIVHVDPDLFHRTEQIRRGWESKTYHMREQDCITFLQDVATSLGKLKVPDRRGKDLPVEYVRRLVEQQPK